VFLQWIQDISLRISARYPQDICRISHSGYPQDIPLRISARYLLMDFGLGFMPMDFGLGFMIQEFVYGNAGVNLERKVCVPKNKPLPVTRAFKRV